jgi:hypothetical protein
MTKINVRLRFGGGNQVTPPITEFWPLLRQLAEAFDRQGLTTDERIQSSLATFRALPDTVRRQMLADVFRLAMDLPDLYAAIVAAQNAREEKKQIWPQGNVG